MARSCRARAAVATMRLLSAVGLVVVAGCATVPQAQFDAAEQRIAELEERLSTNERDREELVSQLLDANDTIARMESDLDSVGADLSLALAQLGGLREERVELLERIGSLEDEAVALRVAAEIESPPEDSVSFARSPQERLAEALSGSDGFRRVDRIGLQNDPRLAARFANAAPGVAADTVAGIPLLFDIRLDYRQTLVFLTIHDPAGGSPELRVNVQYVSDREPLLIRAAVLTIEGIDPVAPIEPIVLSDRVIRETDGTILREAFVLPADRSVVDRLATVLAGGRFTVTMLGTTRQIQHRPTIGERAAMSNILFAYLDIGGLR